MALFNKLFFPNSNASASSATPASPTLTTLKSASNSRTSPTTANNNDKSRHSCNQSVHSKNYLSQFPFDGAQVRVLLYRECDSRGRRLLFDSDALQKVSLREIYGLKGCKNDTKKHHKNHSNEFIECNEEFGYKHNRPKTADIASVGEMVFGALAMSFRGTAFKVHWLQAPARILCSQVFLSPVACANAHSPHSTISGNSLATPRHSISSEYSSADGMSMNSFSMPFTVNVGRHMNETGSERNAFISGPLDVPDHQANYSDSTRTGSSPRYSSTYSTGTDSGYSAMSPSSGTGESATMSSDQWSSSYLYSTLSSMGSVLSDQSAQLRKLSTDSSNFATSSGQQFSSDSSLQRRICRSLRTSLENENSVSDFIGFVSDNYPLAPGKAGGGSEGSVAFERRPSYCGNETRSNPEIGKRRDHKATMANRRAKLGLAVCISLSESFEEEMELFCSEHIGLLESMLSRLRAWAERAYLNHKNFLQIMFHAWQDTQQWFSDLFTAPRIKCHVWLNITASGSKYSKSVAESFMKELCWLLSVADTKNTNFFISTMLTAVLTHHLGWVPTVSSLCKKSCLSYSEASAVAIEQRAKLLEVSQKHPYNALWAQMGDLYGAIGTPPKLARTIVYGTQKVSVEKLLNVLTYFIRCGEVRRSAKREDFDKEQLKSFINQSGKTNTPKMSETSETNFSNLNCKPLGSGLKRSQTCSQNLNTFSDNYVLKGTGRSDDFPERDLINTLKKNEIPNVLAFRDSHFVQQELRIGNYLMDTGILKSSVINAVKAKVDGPEKIRFTVTTPDDIEMPVVVPGCISSESGEEGALEAIEVGSDVSTSRKSNGKNFLWQMVPSIKEGLSWKDVEKLQNGVKLINEKLDQRTLSLNQKHGLIEPKDRTLKDRLSNLSLSDLITQNSMGKSERMTWGIEPIKENVSLEEQIHFDVYQKLMERGVKYEQSKEKDVVFVLGDNEPLVNLKRSTEDLASSSEVIKADLDGQILCPLHQDAHSAVAQMKKHHFGVKFNFETYPQIATNYMKNKNLVMSSYDGQFVLEKKVLQQQQQTVGEAQLKVDLFHSTSSKDQASLSVETNSGPCASCVVCNSILNAYQTPSNATELEFETDEEHSYAYAKINNSGIGLPTVNSATSVDTLKSSPVGTSNLCEQVASRAVAQDSSSPTCKVNSVEVNEGLELIMLPMPGTKEPDGEPGDMKLRAGFIPSLFLNVSDHYVSDMVLQGTIASPKNWEINLREDLALAAHSASLISLPAENVAIVADMEKWDVHLISSQTQCFPYGGGQSAPVGMSQLVSSMLEVVQVMYSAGISAYECLSFLESKLQEIYMHSETLAAFLLDTDFCPLSAVTSALNLSENDVPLLLSVASVHTPQISRKCGISCR